MWDCCQSLTRWSLHLSTGDTKPIFNLCLRILLNEDHQLNTVLVNGRVMEITCWRRWQKYVLVLLLRYVTLLVQDWLKHSIYWQAAIFKDANNLNLLQNLWQSYMRKHLFLRLMEIFFYLKYKLKWLININFRWSPNILLIFHWRQFWLYIITAESAINRCIIRFLLFCSLSFCRYH